MPCNGLKILVSNVSILAVLTHIIWVVNPLAPVEPHNGMVRRGFLEVVEFEEEASYETTRARDRFG